MSLLKYFQFKKKPSEPAHPVESAAPAPTPTPPPPAMPKKAIAILAYNNLKYFTQVFESVLMQQIDGEPFSKTYELFVFQDGLQARHQASQADYDAIQSLCLQKLPDTHFMRQPKNIGTALQFAHVEEFVFATRGFDFCILLEHDFVLAPSYLQTMESLYQRFALDERVAAISVHSTSFKASQDEQARNKQTYLAMSHDWGAGVFKRTWQKRLPAMQSYYKLLGQMPFEQRNNLLIQDWMSFMGFVKGSTSQDTIKACVDSGLQTLRLTPFINQGTYIGAEGMHWNQSIYEAAGYPQTVCFDGDYGPAPELSPENFAALLSNQCQWFLANPATFDAEEFKQRLTLGRTDIQFSPNELSSNATAEDITAAYKMFLGRLPESREVIQTRVGLDMARVLRSFMLSGEFLQRQSNWPVVIEAAKMVLELNKKAQEAASPPKGDAPPGASS